MTAEELIAAFEAEKEARAERKTGWINVKDRLPKISEEVLIASTDEPGNYYCDIGWYTGDEGYDWVEARECSLITDVTHWMPLPDPPEGYRSHE